MSVKDYNKVINIQNGTIGNIEEVLSLLDFDPVNNTIDAKITLGDFLLLRRIKSILENDHDVILKLGYK